MLVAGGSTNVTTYFAMRLAATGAAATGLTATDFDLTYVRSGVASVAKVDATAGTAGGAAAHADNTVVEPDATNQPGLYRIDWPDAAFAAAVREVILTVKVATAFTEHLRVEIDGEVNVVEWAGTDVVAGAIPAFAADAAGGLPVSDAGGLDLDAMNTNINDIETDTNELQGDWTNAGRLDAILDIIAADVVNVDGYNLATQIGTAGAGLTNITLANDLSATMKTSVQTAVDAAIDTVIAELGVAAPATTPTLRTAVMLMYMALRNQLIVQTSGTDAIEIYNDAGTKIASKAITDDSSDYTEAKMA